MSGNEVQGGMSGNKVTRHAMLGNKNSYICVEIPPETKDAIHNYIRLIADKNPNFRPIDYNDIHMTFIFLGNCPFRQIKHIHDNLLVLSQKTLRVFSELENSPGQCLRHPPGGSHPVVTGNFLPNLQACFESTGVELYPPHKQNLLVIKFTAPISCHQFRTELLNVLNVIDTNLWEPHITLGKFKGKRQHQNILPFNAIQFVTDGLSLKHPYLFE